eukprot:gnl/TRDRNA2_/TRDRNA2_180476_c0_seq1.p1 gnl/TRDRNA2_/TRDRNA2_180476_c0~~gnl/TRDRNA2_/TRDRNA2_180476_c0_seq1.p1  ORF type:complete len:213 (+),score=51.03 gnl/TRDRNA2_/TRDRNA2_180476_c0_seq1:73-711(+)
MSSMVLRVLTFTCFAAIAAGQEPSVVVRDKSAESSDSDALAEVTMATQKDVEKLHSQFADELKQAKLDQQTKIQSLGTEVAESIKKKNDEIALLMKDFLASSLDQIKIAGEQGERLVVSTHNGVFGKCCCKEKADGSSESECNWRHSDELHGYNLRECPPNELEYFDTKDAGSNDDDELTRCAKSKSWHTYTIGVAELQPNAADITTKSMEG